MVEGPARRGLIAALGVNWGVAQRRACRMLGFARASVRYGVRRRGHAALRGRLRALAEEWPRYGYRRLWRELRLAGEQVGRKLVWRLYQEEGLKLRPHRKGQPLPHRGPPLRPAVRPGERWAMDFVHDALRGGRPLRILTVLDEGSRECAALEVGTSLGSARVVATLQALAERGRKPRTIVLDKGPEFRSRGRGPGRTGCGGSWDEGWPPVSWPQAGIDVLGRPALMVAKRISSEAAFSNVLLFKTFPTPPSPRDP